MVYDVGDQSDTLYFLAKGSLSCSAALNLKSYNKYPVGNNQWEVLTTTRQVLQQVAVLTPGCIFGQAELRLGTSRRCRIQASAQTKIYFIDKLTYNRCIAFITEIIVFMESEKEDLERRFSKEYQVSTSTTDELRSMEYAQKFKVPQIRLQE